MKIGPVDGPSKGLIKGGLNKWLQPKLLKQFSFECHLPQRITLTSGKYETDSSSNNKKMDMAYSKIVPIF